MNKFALILGLILAVIAYLVLKLIGAVIQFALLAALLGFGTGLVIAFIWRRRRMD